MRMLNMTKITQARINALEIENAELRRDQPSLRDQFAMAALTGLLANSKLASKFVDEQGCKKGMWEHHAYAFADGMMEARDAED